MVNVEFVGFENPQLGLMLCLLLFSSKNVSQLWEPGCGSWVRMFVGGWSGLVWGGVLFILD